MAQRRGSSLLIGSAVAVATGLAFTAGAALRHPPRATTALRPALRGAQLAENGHGSLPAEMAAAVEPQNGFSLFETVYAQVKENYVDKLPGDNKMARGAVRAMLLSLEDPNSYMVEPEERLLLEREAQGILGGIGAALTVRGKKLADYTDYKVHLIAPLPGSPAEQAGLKAGDVITRVDGRWVLGYNPLLDYNRVIQRWQDREISDDEVEKARLAVKSKIESGMSFREAEMVLRGDKAGLKSAAAKAIGAKSVYTVTVDRAGSPVTVTVMPGTTTVETVRSRTLPGDKGYLKIAYFAEGTPAAVKSALASLPKGGLILDLRGNPGGALTAGQEVVGLLAGEGAFGLEFGPRGKQTTLRTETESTRQGPVTVLTDIGTASVAEAVAAVLHERGEATLAGQKTFGDASVQALYTLDDGSGFTLTVGSLASPKGVKWAGVGLTPQIAIAPGTPEDQVLARAVAALESAPARTARGN